MERRGNREEGFTLIELMVVVLIIAILLAIAVPTFFGATKRAQDRSAQTRARNALAAQLAVYAEAEQFSEDPVVLSAAEPALSYVVPPAALTQTGNTVFVDVTTTSTANDTIMIAARTERARCFWIRKVGTASVPRFGEDDCSGTALVWKDDWL